MQQQVTISMQYQAWLDMIDRLEQIITKIESGTEVTDPGAVSELEQIRGILSSPLTVQDSVAQTELSLIKEKLEDIETRLNGTLTTQLTGRYVEVLKRHENNPILLTASNRRFGDNDISSFSQIQPVDYMSHPVKSIYIKNNHDVALNLREILAHFDLDAGGTSVNVLNESISIPAGSTLIVSEELNVQCLGVSIQLTRTTEPTTGDVTVLFIGGV